MALNVDGLKRLQEATEQVLTETQSKIDKLNLMLQDYCSLKERLITLPDKLSYQILAPFGKLGFMHGQLINTNQITILLGDNWFVRTSAKHASGIIERRISNLELQIGELKKQKNLIKPRQQFTSEYLLENNECVEIKEECNDEEDSKWRERHKENLRKSKEKQIHTGKSTSNTEDVQENDESKLWKILEELEEKEDNYLEVPGNVESDEQKNTDTQSNEDDTLKNENSDILQNYDDLYNDLFTNKKTAETESSSSLGRVIAGEVQTKNKKSVSWEDEENEKEIKDLHSTENYDNVVADDDSDEDEEDSDDANQSITAASHHSSGSTIETPGDIYPLYISKPKSILKKTFNNEKAGEENNVCSNANIKLTSEVHKKAPAKIEKNEHTVDVAGPSIEACSSFVVERDVAPSTSNSVFKDEIPRKDNIRISKFKANRLKK
ncbi:hypothetical protein HELRODRAFT_159625 [Helobdella robusta]|uniref:Unconventional prefoldin RPB5 interactor n=1 Tax=Helobdella robusta TaxID=6412 RepID=T1EP93_HELRO|nr:hypothetical protein HELRODRAFT_159625 [Helobdella robusta]ESO13030.1 hypothetical protein HELRODRAFT_159625 [Helobdella robusta]